MTKINATANPCHDNACWALPAASCPPPAISIPSVSFTPVDRYMETKPPMSPAQPAVRSQSMVAMSGPEAVIGKRPFFRGHGASGNWEEERPTVGKIAAGLALGALGCSSGGPAGRGDMPFVENDSAPFPMDTGFPNDPFIPDLGVPSDDLAPHDLSSPDSTQKDLPDLTIVSDLVIRQDLVIPRDMSMPDFYCTSEPVAPLPDLLSRKLLFEDEFNGNTLDMNNWRPTGNVMVNGQQVTLVGTPNMRSQIQSKPTFQYGVVEMKVTAKNGWPARGTDSSFGFELWYNQVCHDGSCTFCHDAVHIVADGNLGVLQSEPDINGDCSQQSKGDPKKLPSDPKYQNYPPISNWCRLRQSKTLYFTLTWEVGGVSLKVSDGVNTGEAIYKGPNIPSTFMEIRLNSDFNAEFSIDHVRVYQ